MSDSDAPQHRQCQPRVKSATDSALRPGVWMTGERAGRGGDVHVDGLGTHDGDYFQVRRASINSAATGSVSTRMARTAARSSAESFASLC